MWRISANQGELGCLFHGVGEIEGIFRTAREFFSERGSSLGEEFLGYGVGGEKGAKTNQVGGGGISLDELGKCKRKRHGYRRMVFAEVPALCTKLLSSLVVKLAVLDECGRGLIDIRTGLLE